MNYQILITLAIVGLSSFGQTYLLIDDNLSEVESSPGVAIIYPRAIGPEIPAGDDLEAKESVESVVTVATPDPVPSKIGTESNVETTTSLPSTTSDNAISSTPSKAAANIETTASGLAPSNGTTVGPLAPKADPTELPASASAPSSVYVPRPQPQPQPIKPAVNRVWHFNNRGINSDSTWARVDRDSEAVESSPKPIYSQRSNPTPPQAFPRKPVFAPEPSPTNSLTADGDLAVGEYAPSNQRNLYYPDINRIGASSAASASASAAASASASSSASSDAPTQYQAAASSISADYGTKGGSPSPFLGNTWQPSVPSPVKAIRKVVMKSGKSISEEERGQGFHSSQQPYRVRVVVQPQAKTAPPPPPAPVSQTNFFERIQDSRSSSSASASASSSSSFSKTSNINQIADQKEFVQIDTKVRTGTKTPPPPPPAAIKTPPPPAPVKSLPPPAPAAIKSPPRPSAPIKSPPRAAIRAPVFEQETEQQYIDEHQPEPEPYSFNFNVNDDSGNGQFRREEGDRNGVVRGSYGYTDAWGLYRIVDYVADKNGFRATIRTNEPGLVERNPVTNEVDNPAQIQIAAEETPAKVVELMRLKKPTNALI